MDLPRLAFNALQVMKKYEDEFKTCEDINGELKYVERRIKESKINVSEVVEQWKRDPDVQIDCLKSQELRKKGNKLYQKKQFGEAAEFYRKALQSFPGRLWEDKTNREDFGLALGNLSTANFEGKKYFDSRANADVLLKCLLENLSAEKVTKFADRSIECSKFLGVHKAKSSDLPSYSSDNFCIVYEEHLGRNGVAVNDISFGDIILIDKPTVARSRAGKQFCTHCLEKLKSKHIYKSPLGDEACFCSLGCIVSAVETYHIYESKLDFGKMFPGKSIEFSNQILLPLRLITQQSPKYFVEKRNKFTEKSPAYGCGSSFQNIDGYPCIESLVTHYADQSSSQRMGLVINAFILYHCLCAMEYLPIQSKLEGLNLFIAASLYQYIAAARYNAHQIDFNSKKAGTIDQIDLYSIGSALYPILPLLNHSCNANTLRFNIGNRVVLVAARNILKGEKVTDSYGLTFLDTEKKTRQNYYKTKYNFLCKCDACTNDFPTFMKLDRELSKEQLQLVELSTKEIQTKLECEDYSTAIILTKQMFQDMVSTNISDLHAVHQKLKIMLGTCCRLQFSVNL